MVLRVSSGRFMHRLAGLNMLLLSTRGRRTGQSKETPLLYLEDGGQYYCAASFGGNDDHPQWYLNLLSQPTVGLLVKRTRVTAIATVISGQEYSKAWTKLVGYYPPFAKYQNRTERTIPVVRFDPL